MTNRDPADQPATETRSDAEDTDDAEPSDAAGAAGRKPPLRREVLETEEIDPAPVDASLEDVVDLFAPEEAPDDIEYGAQPPG